MIKFQVSAPGKMILYGEPLAMYGKNIVAASVDLRTRLKFCEIIDNNRDIIKIEFPDVDLNLNLSLNSILNFFFYDDETDLFLYDNIWLLRRVQYFITLNGMWRTYAQKFSLQTFFFLFIYIANQEIFDIKPFRMHLTTQLAMRAGLGSSTSFTVCLAAAFLHWARLQRNVDGAFNHDDLEKISIYALKCEELIQNYVLELDHDVCSYGRILRFYYNSARLTIKIRKLNVPKMKILLIDSKICPNKREQMKRLAEMRSSYPTSVNIVFNILNTLSKQAFSNLAEINNIHRDNLYQLQEKYAALNICIMLNQEILRDLRLSHPKLDIICAITKRYGFMGKLTSFGGRYVYILLPPYASEENITNLSTHLMLEGFTVTMTSMCCSGVKID
ncbi:mevalonate kinase-like [Polyergus mexicanus]|uniref:mevalonate kinase-like n=1 Tax=Polyergus mexicanus TaxID=615972 RepID=UPI0038B5DF75